MQMIIAYAMFAATVWLLVGIIITGLFVINRPKGVKLIATARLWLFGAVLWPFLVILMFDGR